MRQIISLIMCFCLAGCATSDWNSFMYGNSQGEQWGGICELCNRTFNVSVDVARNSKTIKCCYCGHEQDMQMALNRYTYAVQQQNAAFNQNAVQAFQEVNQKNSEREQAIVQSIVNRPPPQLGPKSTTKCRSDGAGGFNCTEW